MKINNSLDVARWEKTKCTCDKTDVEKCYPIHKCTHCKCEEAWLSVPKEDFKTDKFDSDGKKTGMRTVKEITLVRGHDLQDVIGWSF